MNRTPAMVVALVCAFILLAAAQVAPEFLGQIDPDRALLGPIEAFPFGTDTRGRPLLDYATQGAGVVALPAISAGVLVPC